MKDQKFKPSKTTKTRQVEVCQLGRDSDDALFYVLFSHLPLCGFSPGITHHQQRAYFLVSIDLVCVCIPFGKGGLPIGRALLSACLYRQRPMRVIS